MGRLWAFGDAVHVLPVATALKRAWPESRITWVIQPIPHLMVRDHPAIDDFVVFRRRRGLAGWAGFNELRKDMRGRHFDLLIGLQVYLKAGLITWLTPARFKVGFDRVRARDGLGVHTEVLEELEILVLDVALSPRGDSPVREEPLGVASSDAVEPHPESSRREPVDLPRLEVRLPAGEMAGARPSQLHAPLV